MLLKATPLSLIAIGLVFCFRANRWNIGAEGQMLVGAICGGGGWRFCSWTIRLLHPAADAHRRHGRRACLCGHPALLRVRFGISEILTSLMLVYVAELLLDYLVRGPVARPQGLQFSADPSFSDSALFQPFFEGGRLHGGALLAILAIILATLVFRRTLFGFAINALGEAPRAANFAGFSERRITFLVFAISGALAGLAGVVEAAGQVGQLRPGFGQGLGFTAIIVAFLGRLSPIGAALSAMVIAVLLIGAESAQVVMKLPFDLTRFFMGLLLMCVLAGEALNRYRLVIRKERLSHGDAAAGARFHHRCRDASADCRAR